MTDSGLNSDILKIQALEKEYNAVLNQYEEAYKNCNDELNQNLDQKTEYICPSCTYVIKNMHSNKQLQHVAKLA